ncbi:MAG: hypothetical protein JNM27_18760 [Leptospirales bacterium]|nr:hypothetical protein [Leptospirales bacterium]
MQKAGKFAGAVQIIKFNWPYYAVSLCTFFASVLIQFTSISPWLRYCFLAGGIVALYFTIASVLVSHWIYDRSDLYQLNWLAAIDTKPDSPVANVHAGLDETSHLLRLRYPRVESYDFFDARENTENSIERARKASLNASATPMVIGKPINASGTIFLILAAHEIRTEAARVDFFKGLSQSLLPGGRIVLVEHLRNLPNLLAFGHGFLHFLSDRTWRRSFNKSNLSVKNEFPITPFLRCYILQ